MGRQIRLQLCSHKGATIIEIAAIIAILVMLLSSLIPSYLDRINRAKYEKMINEMTSIAQASIDYYNSQYHSTDDPGASWPTSISQLSPNYLPNADFANRPLNPWGVNDYVLSFPNSGNSNLVEVTTMIPPDVAQSNPEGSLLTVTQGTTADKVSLALSVPNEGIGRVQYEKKHQYNQ